MLSLSHTLFLKIKYFLSPSYGILAMDTPYTYIIIYIRVSEATAIWLLRDTPSNDDGILLCIYTSLSRGILIPFQSALLFNTTRKKEDTLTLAIDSSVLGVSTVVLIEALVRAGDKGLLAPRALQIV